MAVEITLEKIELVKDRTGVSYKESKEALEAADGNVVDAIIAIEENINLGGSGKAREQATQIVDKIKEYVKKGNVSRIVVSKDDEAILNLPVNVSIVGTVLAPWAAVIGVIAAFGTKCRIELVRDDGTIIDVSEKANDKFGDVASKGADIVDSVKEKGSDVYDSAKAKVQDTFSNTANKATVKSEDFKDTVDEMWEAAKKRVEKVEDATEEAASEVKETVQDAVSDVDNAFKPQE
jgi:gas vesicle protein